MFEPVKPWLAGEVVKVLSRPPEPTEVLLCVRGREYRPDRPATFLHVRALDVRERVMSRRLGPGTRCRGRLRMVADFVEECERPVRSLTVSNGNGGDPGTGPGAIRVVGYDVRVAGKVLAVLSGETFLLDAGIPVHVTLPRPTALPRVGEFVQFLLHETPEIDLV